MKVFINGCGIVSPQNVDTPEGLLLAAHTYAGDRLTCIEPAYESFIEMKQLRRMSRLMKMGTVAALRALLEAGVKIPDGIITGTSYGCLDDTGTFLSKMIASKETAVSPTAFMQSTHNTIGSQVALLLQCQGYNQTYTQRSFSFENSLQDALMLLNENQSYSYLVGGVDEVTDISHAILQRFNIFRSAQENSLALFNEQRSGTLNGEGAAYFVLSAQKGADAVVIDSVKTFLKPSTKKLRDGIIDFLNDASLQPDDVDFVLMGKSGDWENDSAMTALVDTVLPNASTGVFKHLCGEYPTASAFAMGLAVQLIKAETIPPVILQKNASRKVKNILIYNSYWQHYHSLILLRAC